MVAVARKGVGLGCGFHRLALTLAVLDDASLPLIEIDQRRHRQLTPLCLKLACRISTGSDAAELRLGTLHA